MDVNICQIKKRDGGKYVVLGVVDFKENLDQQDQLGNHHRTITTVTCPSPTSYRFDTYREAFDWCGQKKYQVI